ncbi:equilibrative nucleoside transporter 3 isoform X3 [Leptinotarsa decemlineata]|uniref:equilibrative nucleoside transporter 3 isoform X3 n=1 Tax=Leptinotarsa decemlineata TaxID=7539 RepID=UPI003D30CB1E
MADLKQYNEVFERKASLLSTEKFSQKLDNPPAPPPEDKYYFIMTFFVLLGFAIMIPFTFLLTATDYWMYKFRDVSQENYDPNNKTFLQTNFASISSMLSSVPTALTTVLVSLFAHRIDLRLRLLGAMIAMSMSFISFTILVKVNTDSYLKEVFKRIWLVLLPMVLTIPVMGLSSTTITILIVSESGGSWGKKFFMPVSTFLLKEISGLLGGICAAPIMTRKNAKWFILLNVLQAYGFGILIPLCNAKPRSHLPVLFPHDWQYMSLMTVNGFIMGYCTTVIYLSMSNFAGDRTEQAFLLFQGIMIILMSVTSPLSQVWLNIL